MQPVGWRSVASGSRLTRSPTRQRTAAMCSTQYGASEHVVRVRQSDVRRGLEHFQCSTGRTGEHARAKCTARSYRTPREGAAGRRGALVRRGPRCGARVPSPASRWRTTRRPRAPPTSGGRAGGKLAHFARKVAARAQRPRGPFPRWRSHVASHRGSLPHGIGAALLGSFAQGVVSRLLRSGVDQAQRILDASTNPWTPSQADRPPGDALPATRVPVPRPGRGPVTAPSHPQSKAHSGCRSGHWR